MEIETCEYLCKICNEPITKDDYDKYNGMCIECNYNKDLNKTKIINLFGNPGAGKSTTAAYLFSELKARGYEAELVQDIAKDLVWDENWRKLKNQLFVFAEQLDKIDRLVGKVEYVITDTPLLLHIGYYKERRLPLPKQFTKLVLAYNKKYNNINIYLKPNVVVSAIGRAEPDLDPMKYLSKYTYDIKTTCKDREKILEYILHKRLEEN